MLSAQVFKNSGVAPPEFLPSLTFSGAGQGVNDKLTQWKRNPATEPLVVPVITINRSETKVTDSRLVTRGPLLSFDKEGLGAKVIWEEAEQDVSLQFTVKGSDLTFNNPDCPNISQWVELKSLTGYTVLRGDVVVDTEEANNLPGVKSGACLRLVLHHYSSKVVRAYCQIIPTNLATLQAKARAWDIPPWLMPGLNVKGEERSNRFINWALLEEGEPKLGFGTFPLLELVGVSAHNNLPTRAKVQEEMVKLLRGFVEANQLPGDDETFELAIRGAQIPPMGPWQVDANSRLATLTWPSITVRAPTVPGKRTPQLLGKAKPSREMRESPRGKYDPGNGFYDLQTLERDGIAEGLPQDLQRLLVDNANASLSWNTWRSLSTVMRLIKRCEQEANTSLQLPWDKKMLSLFTAWCLRRNNREATIGAYLSKVNKERLQKEINLLYFI